MTLESNLNNRRTIDVDGDFTPAGKAVDFEIRLNEFKLQALNPYVENILDDLEGTGNVALTLDGTLDQPKLNGTIGFNRRGRHRTFSELPATPSMNPFESTITTCTSKTFPPLMNMETWE